MIERKIPAHVAWLVSPALLIGAITSILAAERNGWSYAAVTGIFTVFSAFFLIALELRYPLEERWKMTWRSFGRDLKYFATGGPTIGATNALFAAIGVTLATGHQGPASNWPLIVAVPLGLFVVDFLQYWQHRFSHEAKGALGAWYWRVHVAHHLPDKVYVAMHPAGHPINGFVVRGLVTIVPLYLLGFSPEAVALINIIIGIIGLISHTNIDLRAGALNYVFAGSELHRYHHSADPADNGNYAVALSLIDVLFGTLKYRPGVPPVALGVHDPSAYPDSNALVAVLKLPFARPNADFQNHAVTQARMG
jgi:sterol desaturase/sphingolipid hydroxylase (fatty acid hydroxylase superfamily)